MMDMLEGAGARQRVHFKNRAGATAVLAGRFARRGFGLREICEREAILAGFCDGDLAAGGRARGKRRGDGGKSECIEQSATIEILRADFHGANIDEWTGNRNETKRRAALLVSESRGRHFVGAVG